MPIYDSDGTTNYPIGKVYDFDGTATYQTGKAYDSDGLAEYLLYNAETILPALNAPVVNTGGANEVMYSAYVSSEPVDCSAGDTISFTAFVHAHADTGGEHGAVGAICLQLVRRVNGVDTTVLNKDSHNMYIENGQGFASCAVFSIGSDNYAQADFSYVVPSGEDGAYYVKVRSAIQRAASDKTPTGWAQAYTSEIMFK